MKERPLLWTATLVVCCSFVSLSNAWSLGRPFASKVRLGTASFPQRYRHLDDLETSAGTSSNSNERARYFWKSSSSLRNSTFYLVSPLFRSPSSITDQDSSFESLAVRNTQKKRVVSKKRVIQNVQQLRKAVLDDGLELKQTQLEYEPATIDVQELLSHDVIQLISKRAASNSLPGRRTDNATLALSMEGGGMRGAVSAGMAAAIASLGLHDAFDAIYGSSAGSVVGAFMVSRQMCVDVYTQVLPAATTKFVCKKRMVAGLFANALDWMLGNVFVSSKLGTPGMNISFVLDGIMDPQHGLRPLDMESFQENDKVQPLRIATSCVQNGKLKMKSLGTKEFFAHVDPVTNQTIAATIRQDGKRKGLFACLEAGMTVPGATGPPVKLVDGNGVATPCFDAFCFEPLPYRSAVEDGATHVLVLRSRPECFQPKTAPGVYEKGVAPIYFRSHGEEDTARFFEKGGQQYIYLEDILTLEEGRQEGLKHDGGDGVAVPPTTILYGVDKDEAANDLAVNRDSWKKAHLLPITVPKGTPELSTLEQGQDQVLEAVRGGFAVAFDLLAPAAGLELDKGMTGERVAKLIFPKQDVMGSIDGVLGEQVSVRGHSIDGDASLRTRKRKRLAIKNLGRRISKPFRLRRRRRRESSISELLLDGASSDMETQEERCHRQDAQALLGMLPGIQNGNLPPISDGLRFCQAIDTLL